MKTSNLAGIRSARSSACISLGGPALAACSGLALCLALSWGTLARATTAAASRVDTSSSSSDARALELGCEGGDAVQCNDLGVTYLHGYGVSADVRVALRAFDRSCRHGSSDGCGNLGALYESGVGVEANLLEAARLYEQACTMGCALGCSNLGALYARGLGVDRDLDEAQRLFLLACETDSAAGCHNLLQLRAAPL